MTRIIPRLLPLLPATLTILPGVLSTPLPNSAPTTAALPTSLTPRSVKNCDAANASCTCQEWTFAQPDWFVSDFYYRKSTEIDDPSKADQPPLARGYVSFLVRNKAVAYHSICSASSDRPSDFFRGQDWATCEQNRKDDKGPGLTWFRYDKSKDRFEVKQSWVCEDSGRYAYQALGKADSGIECMDEQWENPSWEEGETFRMNTTDCMTRKGVMKVPWSEISGM